MLHIALIAASLAATGFSSVRPHHPVAAPPLRLSRVDQASRYFAVGGLRPNERVEVYVDGRLLASGVARGGVERLRLARPLRPGATVSVVAGYNRLGVQRAATLVQNDYLQYRYDGGRTGWNPGETALTVANVRKTTFGHLNSFPVDGFVLAQPLYVGGVTIGSNTYNLLIVATENDSVYAFDADTGALVWRQNYVNTANGESPIPYQAVIADDIEPVIGITSTPAIDPDTNTIYFVAAIQQSTPTGDVYHQYLHAVDLTTGLDRTTPADITATALMSNGTPVTFDPLVQLNRAALLLANGAVYIGFGSHSDAPFGKPHGWIFAYDATTLGQLAFFNTSLTAGHKFQAGIWAAGWGPVTDANGDVYFSTGDGPFDGDLGGEDWAQSVLEMTPSLSLVDYFTPFDEGLYQQHDLGSGGLLLLPDQPGAFTRLAAIAGDQGNIYLLNRDALGGFTIGGPDAVVAELPRALGLVRGGPGYYTGPNGAFLYFCGLNNPLEAYAVATTPTTQLVLSSVSAESCGGGGGAIPTVSSNGSTPGTGIVWMTNRPQFRAVKPVILRAYDATDLTHRLVAIQVQPWMDPDGWPFIAPTVINGDVFLGMSASVEEYGLLSRRRR